MNLDIITGLQPTGSIHLGNYLGAIKPFLTMQERHRCGMFIADYHAITMPHDPATLRRNVDELGAMLVACGVDPRRTVLFKQSQIRHHTEMAWILQCTASRFGWLNRMVQFRDKYKLLDNLAEALDEIAEASWPSVNGDNPVDRIRQLAAEALRASNVEGPSVGLFTYPVLQAADILLYGTKYVPVGEDQKQHLNLTVDIANKFNLEFGETLVVPKALVTQSGGRIMSLFDPTKKMSKSDPDPMTRINLDDDDDMIAKKIKRATSDTDLIPGAVEGLQGRLALQNLLTIYSVLSDLTLAETVEQFAGKGYGVLKPALTERLIEVIRPIRSAYLNLMQMPEMLKSELNFNEATALSIANETLVRVKTAIGIY